MADLTNRLHDLVFHALLTPENLVQNAKLCNYKYVSFRKGPHGLMATTCCDVDPGKTIEFLYFFDNEDRLQTIEMVSEAERVILFDRTSEAGEIERRIVYARLAGLSGAAV